MPWRKPLIAQDFGQDISGLVPTVALGGDYLADIVMLQAELAVFGPVASGPTISRLIDTHVTTGGRALGSIYSARAKSAGMSGRWPKARQRKPLELSGEILDEDPVLAAFFAHRAYAVAARGTCDEKELAVWILQCRDIYCVGQPDVDPFVLQATGDKESSIIGQDASALRMGLPGVVRLLVGFRDSCGNPLHGLDFNVDYSTKRLRNAGSSGGDRIDHL
ncbi:hypothetical protein ACFOOM_29180 [Streptomyces echinoruber]|uniref:hypothetical protein n=1 Tax=Streptomyces echinoruber TaxID=68898 RepID=UPI00167D24E2|nr:hypothetical protein [Streptomyces echinoruber]